jgi:coenzyme PQQ synthesis protein D (PqqD)
MDDLRAARMVSRPRRRAGIEPVVLDDEIVAFDSATAMLHYLNVPASVFWSACDGTRTLGELARMIAARSDQSLDAVEAQLLDLVDALVARDLLTLDGRER